MTSFIMNVISVFNVEDFYQLAVYLINNSNGNLCRVRCAHQED